MKTSSDTGTWEYFLKEVRLTYGPRIEAICRQKLAELNFSACADDAKILEDAKQEAGFRTENSTLRAAALHFCS